MDLAAFGENWLRHAGTRLRPNTLVKYRFWLDTHIVPALGARDVPTLTRRDVLGYIDRIATAGLSAGSVRLGVAVLRAVLAHAVDLELLAANPAQRLMRILPRRNDAHRMRALTRSERDALLIWITARRPQFAVLFLVLSRTGLRIGEALGLQWPDVDVARGVLHVERTWHSRRDGIGPPKSGRARDVELSEQTARVLERWRARARNRWVFPAPHGEPYSAHTVWLTMKAAVRGIGLHFPASTHDLRHTCFSLLVSSGESMEAVRRMAGHASITTTQRYATHLPLPRSTVLALLDD